MEFQLVKLADPVLRRARLPKTLEGRALGVSPLRLGCLVRARVSATHRHPCAAGDLHVWPFVPRPLLWAYYKVKSLLTSALVFRKEPGELRRRREA